MYSQKQSKLRTVKRRLQVLVRIPFQLIATTIIALLAFGIMGVGVVMRVDVLDFLDSVDELAHRIWGI